MSRGRPPTVIDAAKRKYLKELAYVKLKLDRQTKAVAATKAQLDHMIAQGALDHAIPSSRMAKIVRLSEPRISQIIKEQQHA